MAWLLPVLAGATKVAGGAALKGAALVGKGALAAGKTIGSGALKVGSQIGKAAKGMLGGGAKGTSQGAIGAAKQALVPGLQNIGQQAAGAIPGQVATGALGAGKTAGSGMFDAIMRTIGKSATDKEKEAIQPQQPGIIGGEQPMPSIQMPQFTRPPSMGALIAQMLAAKRGY